MERSSGWTDWRWVYAAGVLVVLGALLYSVRVVLTPITLFLLLILLLSPYAGDRRHALVVTGATLLVLLWVLETTGFLLAPFVLALALAYILDPLVDVIERRRVPRGLAVGLLALPAFGALVLGVALGVPALADQVEALIDRAPEALQRVEAWARGARGWILAVDVPFIREDALLAPLRDLRPEQVVAFLRERQEAIAQRSWEAVLGLGRGIGTLFAIFGYVVLTPVLTFYLLRDYDRIAGWVAGLVPQPKRASWLAFLEEYDRLLSRYLRGQVLAAAAVGTLTGVGFWLAGLPYGGLVGAIAGVFNLVPYLGLVVSLVPAVLIALLSGSILASLLKVAVVFAAVQIIDSMVLGPRIVGGSVGLHPVWVMLSLAVGGFFLGFVGLLLAVPAAVLFKLLLGYAIAQYRTSAVYLGRPAAGAERPARPAAEKQPV
ncbi:MAG TPA: AI-2E family transporter [Longimicrobiales bacterium]